MNEIKNKKQRIISFFAGMIFNIFGVFVVAIWKCLFCYDDDKSKYCFRSSILGAILGSILVEFMFGLSLLYYISKYNNLL